MSTAEHVQQEVERYLAEAEVEWEPGARDGEYVVTLPGERKLKTVCSLLIGEKAIVTTAFVIRHADENEAEFFRFLLRRNLRRPGVGYAVDEHGDVYVVTRAALRAVDGEYLDTLFGTILEAADGAFNELLVIGFRSSMQKEWNWRISRGESTRNLEAFRHLLDADSASADAK
ncbi:YbjN domain-containing protein [Rudaeicoccus suwonensis]|uniref:Putative sensory transduction regulator n=1 Tax=Rudaeicoccus suwonensis TaxID=657409 RepID=A0A561E7N3_9MICO|nr:YbjN domain-containing protein [Rudaeicoccus suwonensis]TWE11622.1 putative sensory transduction regulator [Rudaeicoccus suwonensis]